MYYFIALIPAIVWGSIGLVQRKAGGKPSVATIGSMTGFLILSIIITVFTQTFLPPLGFALGMLSGILLAFANIGQFTAMNRLGVATAVPLVAAQQLVINVMLSAFLFHEWRSLFAWVMGITAVILVVIGGRFINYQDSGKKQSKKAKAGRAKGMIAVAVAGISGGLYAFVPKAYQVYGPNVEGGVSFSLNMMLPQAIGGIVASMILYYFVEKKENPFIEFKKPDLWKNTSVGVLWAVGNLCLLIAGTSSMGQATAFTFSQMNIVVASMLGILVLHEHKTKKELVYLVLGNILVVGGAILTALIQPLAEWLYSLSTIL